MKLSNIKCNLKHQISTMIICEGYMFELSVSKDMEKIKLTMVKGEFEHIL